MEYKAFSLDEKVTGRYRTPFSEKEVKDGQVQTRLYRIIDSLASLAYLDDEKHKLPEIYRRFLPNVALIDEPSSDTLYDLQSNIVNLALENKGDLDLVKGAAYFLHTLFAYKKFTEFLDCLNDPDKRLQAEFLYGIIHESYAFWCLRCKSNPLVNNLELSQDQLLHLPGGLTPDGLTKMVIAGGSNFVQQLYQLDGCRNMGEWSVKRNGGDPAVLTTDIYSLYVGAFLGDLLFQYGLSKDVRRIYFETPSVFDQFDELVKIAEGARELPRK